MSLSDLNLARLQRINGSKIKFVTHLRTASDLLLLLPASSKSERVTQRLLQERNLGDPPGKEERPMNLLKRLITDESAQDLAEYGIALAVIAVGAGAIAVVIAGNVSTLWQNAQTAIAAAV